MRYGNLRFIERNKGIFIVPVRIAKGKRILAFIPFLGYLRSLYILTGQYYFLEKPIWYGDLKFIDSI